MKIAILTDGISPFVTGGLEKHSYFLAKHLVMVGYEVDLFHCLYDINQKLPTKSEIDTFFFKKEYSFNKVFSYYFPKSIYFPGHYLYSSFKYSNLLFNTIKENGLSYDFIYSKGFTSWKFLIKKSNFIIATNFHGYEMFQKSPNLKYSFKKYLFRLLVKWIINRSSYIVSYGGKITKIIKSINYNKIKVVEISAAIEKSWILTKLDNQDQGANNITANRKIIFIGRNEERKGFKELIAAINKFDFKIPLEFHFIGPDLKSENLIKNDFYVKFYGLIKDDDKKKQIIDECDVLICPSFSEGMPNVILEAMSRGLAVIASKAGANSLLVDNDNGILIDKITVSNIHDSLIMINNMNEKDLYLKKLNSLKKIKNFSWEIVINHVSNMIKGSKYN